MRLLREASDLRSLGLLARKIRSLAGSQSMPVGLGPYVWAVQGSLAREAWLSGVLGKGMEKGGQLSGLGRQNWERHRSRKSLVLHLEGEGDGGQRLPPQPHSEPFWREGELLQLS